MTSLAAVAVVFALAGLVAGVALAWTELIAIGIAALMCLAIAALFLIGRANYRISLSLATFRVAVGDLAAGRIVVGNDGSRAVLASRIELPVGATLAEFGVPRLGVGAAHEELFTIPTQRRAVVPVGPVRSVRGDPLGLLRREMTWGTPQELYVHPKTIALDKVTAGFLRDMDGRPVPELSDSDVAFHALRDYRPGDDRRSVHWKSTARVGRYMVRQYEETRRWHLAIALSTAKSDYADPDEFELAVSVAGSLGVHAIVDGRELTVLTHDKGLHTLSPSTLLDQLSGVEPATRPETIVQLAQDVSTTAPDASIAVLITGSAVDTARLEAAHNRLPIGALRIAVTVAPGAAPTRNKIGDLAVLTIGTLAELPRALRGFGT